MRISDWSSDVCSSDLRAGGVIWSSEFCRVGPARSRAARTAVSGGNPAAIGATAFAIGRAASPTVLATSFAASEIVAGVAAGFGAVSDATEFDVFRSEEHTSELQSLMRTSYHVF